MIDNLYILQFIIKRGIRKKKNKISFFWIAFNNVNWKKREDLKKKRNKEKINKKKKRDITLGNEK